MPYMNKQQCFYLFNKNKRLNKAFSNKSFSLQKEIKKHPTTQQGDSTVY